MKNRSSGKLYS